MLLRQVGKTVTYPVELLNFVQDRTWTQWVDATALVYKTINSEQLSEANSLILAIHELLTAEEAS